MKLKTGDIYWIELKDRIPHPYILIKLEDKTSLVMCRVTSNKKKASMPGNVILEKGEGNLNKESIADAADIITVKEASLGDYIGSVSALRVKEINRGIEFINKTYFNKS